MGVMGFCVLLHQPEVGGDSWKWLSPVKAVGTLGLPVSGPGETGGNNVLVHSVRLPTDETDRGVDQQDGKSQSPGCEESDAGREELLKMRLPTRSDMICGYACLKGIAK